jgi:hypothetical protein
MRKGSCYLMMLPKYMIGDNHIFDCRKDVHPCIYERQGCYDFDNGCTVDAARKEACEEAQEIARQELTRQAMEGHHD